MPVDASEAGKEAFLEKIGYGFKDRFALVLELFRQDETGDNSGDGNGGTRTWQQVITTLVESYRDPEYAPNGLASFQILSSTRETIKVRLDVIYADQLNFLITHQEKPAARISGLVRLKPARIVRVNKTTAPSLASEAPEKGTESANASAEFEPATEAGPP